MPKAEVTDSANATAIEKSRNAELRKADQQEAPRRKAEGGEDNSKSTATRVVGWLRTSLRASKGARALPSSAAQSYPAAAARLVSAPVPFQGPASAARARGRLDLLGENEPSPTYGFDMEQEGIFNVDMVEILDPPETSRLFAKSGERQSILEAFKKDVHKYDMLELEKTWGDLRDMSTVVQNVEKCWKESHNPYGLDRELAKELADRLKSAGFEQLSEASEKWSGSGIRKVVKDAWWDETMQRRNGSKKQAEFDDWFGPAFGEELNRVAGGIIELKKTLIDVIRHGESGLPTSRLCLLEPPSIPAAPASTSPAQSEPKAAVGSASQPKYTAPFLARNGNGRISQKRRKDPQRRFTRAVLELMASSSATPSATPSAAASATVSATASSTASAATAMPAGEGLQHRKFTPEPL